MIELILYARPACHLCEEMAAVVARVARDVPLTLTKVDIDTDRDLKERFGLSIPVLRMGGRTVAKVRVDEHELRRRLERYAADPG